MTSITAEIPTKFCSTIKTGRSTHCDLRSGAKSAVYEILVVDLLLTEGEMGAVSYQETGQLVHQVHPGLHG